MSTYRDSWCRSCGQHFSYEPKYSNGRKLEYCPSCYLRVKRNQWKERKARQRMTEKLRREHATQTTTQKTASKGRKSETPTSSPSVLGGGARVNPEASTGIAVGYGLFERPRNEPNRRKWGLPLPPHTNKGGSNPL